MVRLELGYLGSDCAQTRSALRQDRRNRGRARLRPASKTPRPTSAPHIWQVSKPVNLCMSLANPVAALGGLSTAIDALAMHRCPELYWASMESLGKYAA
jgi:hypothetical protein